ncbi:MULTISPECIES: flagella biosynthesis chaperone for FliD, FliT [Shewanella]|uniref:flagella biosynthesis chaperone for FliD, FliT n=1 Tax=Shewanella TaxID=22 RepID=UPI00166E6700|nr:MULTISPECIES: flagella biosynthesis chaperone for FliD, FliT [Shewanella]MCL1071942.1 flagella biosynthesis chaperone for FliD, FliT [Shewanella xiamenensis]QYK10405.1 flagella biosynthesis chaperone for FliD, FliT [Shewanella mangrovisoli]WHF56883.1 flagella biosynthesis chaperone for FliD, FliT [Shewanella xiamenensis]GGM97538.1 hypothetical protein GCM10009124_27990 [Shewanella xiamenensis]
MEQLDELNSELLETLQLLEKIAAEDEASDDLVSKLLEQVERRQVLLNTLAVEPTEECRVYLEKQFDLTNELIEKSKIVQSERQVLLQMANRNKRQINVYKAIDLDR